MERDWIKNMVKEINEFRSASPEEQKRLTEITEKKHKEEEESYKKYMDDYVAKGGKFVTDDDIKEGRVSYGRLD